MHEVKKYPYDACDFFASQNLIIRTHKQSVHEGKKYQCDACDFLSPQKESLGKH